MLPQQHGNMGRQRIWIHRGISALIRWSKLAAEHKMVVGFLVLGYLSVLSSPVHCMTRWKSEACEAFPGVQSNFGEDHVLPWRGPFCGCPECILAKTLEVARQSSSQNWLLAVSRRVWHHHSASITNQTLHLHGSREIHPKSIFNVCVCVVLLKMGFSQSSRSDTPYFWLRSFWPPTTARIIG